MIKFARQLVGIALVAALAGGAFGWSINPSRTFLVAAACAGGVTVLGLLFALGRFIARDLDERGEPGAVYPLTMFLLLPFLGPLAVLLTLATWRMARDRHPVPVYGWLASLLGQQASSPGPTKSVPKG